MKNVIFLKPRLNGTPKATQKKGTNTFKFSKVVEKGKETRA